MTDLPSIDLGVYEQLADPEFRKAYFEAETSELIARQLLNCRKHRSLNQSQLAEKAGTHQPLISRVEDADYRSWSFKTLRKLADALDARLRVLIEPWEDVREEYRDETSNDRAASVWTAYYASFENSSRSKNWKECLDELNKYRDQQSCILSAHGETTRSTVPPTSRSRINAALPLSIRSIEHGTA